MCPTKGGEAASTLLNSLGARFATWEGRVPREERGPTAASRATASEPPKSVHESGVCAHSYFCVQRAYQAVACQPGQVSEWLGLGTNASLIYTHGCLCKCGPVYIECVGCLDVSYM